jgi:hypothetical protein
VGLSLVRPAIVISAAAVIRKPNSVRLRSRPDGRGLRRDDHSSSPTIAGGIKQPTRKHRTGRPKGLAARASLFGLAPCGVLPATRVATGAVRSYRTFSPLLAEGGRCIFCATFLQVTLTGRYPAHCPAEFGLSFSLSGGDRLSHCGGENANHPLPVKCRTARASCTDCCAASRSPRRSSRCSSCSRGACRPGRCARPTP